ncbi:MAG: protein CpxP [Arcticibacterium sp.]|jgi:protein CpxP
MQNINIKWIWVMAGLLLLNLGLLAYLILGGKNQANQRQPRPLLETTLNFTEEQSSDFEMIREEHRETSMALNDEIKSLRDVLFSDFTSSKDATGADSVARKIANLHVKLDLATLNHFKDVRSLCTEEQKATFDASIGKMLQGGPPRPMPQGGPNMGQGPGGRQDPPPPMGGDPQGGGPPPRRK